MKSSPLPVRPFKNLILAGKALLGLAIATMGLSGCSSVGPDHLRDTHPLYNDAIIDTFNEQFLNNLVRLRYSDPTFFLDISNVAATMSLSVNGTVTGQVSSSPFTIGTDSTYQMQPTISYAPLQGEEFVKSLLSPISVDALLALTGSGWSMQRVFGLCVESINGIENAPSASGPTPENAPTHYKDWNHLVSIFELLEDDHVIEGRMDKKSNSLKVRMENNPQYVSEVREIKSMLKLNQHMSIYDVEADDVIRRPDTLYFVTRPLMSTFFYLSHSVDTPEEHQSKGWVTISKKPDGSPFDWSETPAGRLFHVRVSKEKPEDAFVTIPYESYWFYIPKDDRESKSTFLLLTQLFRLQAGAAKSVGPTLTLPVR